MTVVLGTGSTGRFTTNVQPTSFREGILHMWPNGRTPLTALTSLGKKRKEKDMTYTWFPKVMPVRGGAVTGVYTNAGLSSAYSTGAVKGDVLYIKCAEATADHFRAGNVARLTDANVYTTQVTGRVTGVVKNGASSYVAVKLNADDPDTTALTGVDGIMVAGSMHEEGGESPDSLRYNATEYTNYCQHFRTAQELTKDEINTYLRTGDSLKEAYRECAELHAVEMELGFMFGDGISTTANGMKIFQTEGLVPMALDHGVTADFESDTDYSGATWLEKGKTWLNDYLKTFFQYGATEVWGLAGTGAILGIQELAEAYGTVNLQPMATEYGMNVSKWGTYFGTITLKSHPLLSTSPTTADQNTILLFDPKMLGYHYFQDTQKNEITLANGADRVKFEYQTKAGISYEQPTTLGLLRGVGLDSAV